jgi:hypothetical protein
MKARESFEAQQGALTAEIGEGVTFIDLIESRVRRGLEPVPDHHAAYKGDHVGV